MRSVFLRWAAFAAAGIATLAVVHRAKAADCSDLTADGQNNNIPKLYIENGDTQEPLLKRLGKELLHSANPVRLIYRNRPTCNIRTDMFNKAKMVFVQDGSMAPFTPRPVKYIKDDPNWD